MSDLRWGDIGRGTQEVLRRSRWWWLSSRIVVAVGLSESLPHLSPRPPSCTSDELLDNVDAFKSLINDADNTRGRIKNLRNINRETTSVVHEPKVTGSAMENTRPKPKNNLEIQVDRLLEVSALHGDNERYAHLSLRQTCLSVVKSGLFDHLVLVDEDYGFQI